MSTQGRVSFIIDDMLTGLLAAGATVTVLASPQAADLLSKPVAKRLQKRFAQRELRKLIHYMKRQQLIEVEELDDSRVRIKVTQKGKVRIEEQNYDHMIIRRPLKWDRKWRVVIFDVPERYKSGRDAMRSKLRNLGFKQVQRSVWVHPFPCLEEIAIIRNRYRLGKYVTLIEADTIESHNTLVKLFANILKPTV